MTDSGKVRKFITQWPISLVALGIALTLIWIAAVAWIPLRLLVLT
jgi:hypothetical protein